MKRIATTLVIILLTLFSTNLFAEIDTDELQEQRMEVIKTYVKLVGHGNYQDIPKLFTSHAVAVSSSGQADSVDHFFTNLFLKTMKSPQSRLINIFDGQLKNNMMTAYYNLTWLTNEGIPVSKKFLDLFIFQADSIKIKTVYVFSNDFQENSLESQNTAKSA